MKKNFLCFISTLLVLIFGLTFVGCNAETADPSTKDYNADIQAVAPENIDTEHFDIEEDTTYYTSPGFSLMMEVNGEFFEMKYFSIDLCSPVE